jgi:hypothetical protein
MHNRAIFNCDIQKIKIDTKNSLDKVLCYRDEGNVSVPLFLAFIDISHIANSCYRNEKVFTC